MNKLFSLFLNVNGIAFIGSALAISHSIGQAESICRACHCCEAEPWAMLFPWIISLIGAILVFVGNKEMIIEEIKTILSKNQEVAK